MKRQSYIKPVNINLFEFFKGRELPQNMDAEATVLSDVMNTHSVDRVADIVKSEHFFSVTNGLIYQACLDLAESRQFIDVLTVADRLRGNEQLLRAGGAAYISSLSDATPTVSNVEAHAAIVFKLWRRRELVHRCMKIAVNGYGTVDDDDAFFDEAENWIHELSNERRGGDILPLRDSITKAFEAIQAAAQRGSSITGTSTGFSKIDSVTSGMHAGDLWIVAGRPGMGKSAFVMDLAMSVAWPKAKDARGEPVAVFSLEMPREQIGTRLICGESRVGISQVRNNTLRDEDWSAITQASTTLAPLPIYIDDTAGMTLPAMRAQVRKVERIEKRKVGLVIVDYLQLMGGSDDAFSREQEVANLSRGLKRVAKEIHVPVVALAQLNRECEKRKPPRPQLADLRDSGSIEQDADNILLLYRDEYYNPQTTQLKGVAEVHVAKQRNGPTARIFLGFDGKCTRFFELPPQQYEEAASLAGD